MRPAATFPRPRRLCVLAYPEADLTRGRSATSGPDPAVAPVQPTPALAKGMAKLAFMRGVWAGPATGTTSTSQRYSVTQTSMGPSISIDGETLTRHFQGWSRLASMGPSISIDGEA